MTQSNAPGGGALPGASPGRDPRLERFAEDGSYASALPSALLAGVLEELADGTGRPPPGATDDEVVGMLSSWQALESRAHSRMLAVLRELIRRRPRDGAPAGYPGDLPGDWDKGTAHEAAFELGISWQSAAPLLALAWDLEARLPGTGALLDQGVLTGFKARIVSDEFTVLDDEKTAEAEKLLLGHDLSEPSMTPGRIRKLCQRISDTVDPDGARERRETARRESARVSFFRAHGGDTRMFAQGLPADDSLLAQQSIQARALAYRDAGIYPDDTMDCLRVLAMLDLINQTALDHRIARYRASQAEEESQATRGQAPPCERSGKPGQDTPSFGTASSGTSSRTDDGLNGDPPGKNTSHTREKGPGSASSSVTDASSTDGASSTDDADGTNSTHGACDMGSPLRTDSMRGTDAAPGGAQGGTAGPGLPSLLNLTLPLATLLGLAERPGEVPGYGSVDPGLVRDLARAAAVSPRTRTCLTITNEDGHAVGHACARRIRGARVAGNISGVSNAEGRSGPPGTADHAGPAPARWDLRPDLSRPGPDDGYGAWTLTLSDGSRYRLDIRPVPLTECDHRYATGSYRPGALLRHLTEVRDGECVSPACSHPARLCDYEHATPWGDKARGGQGGRTDLCNAGPVSRACHRVKQSTGWNLSNPQPAVHRWRTPSGRTYDKGPKSWPA